MTINYIEFINAAEYVARKEDMKVAVKYSGTAAAATAITTFVGGIMLGPAGFFAGGALGGLGSWLASENKFKSVVTIIREMSEEDKMKLANHLYNAVKDFDIFDLVAITNLVMREEKVFEAVKMTIHQFVRNELHKQLA